MDLTGLASALRAGLDAKTSARERSLAASREAIRACGNAIRALHRYEIEPATALLDEAQGHLDAAREVLAGHDDVLHAGFVHDAEKELAEARITFALVTDAPFPSPDDLGLTPAAFLKGMAEAIGELRRHILDLMRKGDLERCEQLLGAMDDMYYVLVSMDYPDGITFGLRRLTDVARSIIERTRGDFTTSSIQRTLRSALEDHADQIRRTGPPPPG
jgi:translin